MSSIIDYSRYSAFNRLLCSGPLTTLVTVIIACLFTSFNASAQERVIESKQHITISEGIAHNGITSIIEDDKGYLWIATYDGLNRYDGYEFKLFRNTTDNKILVSNRIRTINEDEKGNLWLGTDEGISIFDHDHERFKNIYSNKLSNQRLRGPIVRKILFDADSNITICATEGFGLLLFGEEYNFIGQYLPSQFQSDVPIEFLDGVFINHNNYLFTTSIGLLLFDLKTKTFQQILRDDITACNSISIVDASKLLITMEQGISVVNYSTADDSVIFQLLRQDLLGYRFNSSMIDALDNIWLGTLSEGFIHIDDIGSVCSGDSYQLSTFQGSSGYLRSSTFYSSGNNCWAGSFNQGLFKFDLDEKPFNSIKTRNRDDYGLFSDDIHSLVPIDSNRFYVISEQGGLVLFNSLSDNFEPLPFRLADNLKDEVSSVFIDSKGTTWLHIKSTQDVYKVSAGQQNPEKVGNEQLSAISEQLRFYTTREDSNGSFWIGGDNDVFKVDFRPSGEIDTVQALTDHPFFSDNVISLIRYLYVDPQYDFTWVGTAADGLIRIGLDKDLALGDMNIDQYINDAADDESISSNSVTSINRLPDGTLWIGTEQGGLCRVDDSQESPSFRTFSESQGLSNNVVKKLIYDNDHFWITTNIGLNKFNVKDYAIRNFNKEDGLPFEDFKYAGAKLNNGYIVVSGLDGFCYFDPEKLTIEEELPKLEFGELRILNQLVTPGDTIRKRVLLERGLADGEELNLKYNENVFSIEVNALHFSNPKNHFIRHRLSPINEGWIEVPSNQRVLSYTGLQPGDYILRVMASNALGQWSDSKELKISISPPVWKTTWAYILYAILVGALLYLIMFIILRFQSLNHNLQIEKIEKETAKDLNVAKFRFFSNISHELKTPITLISGPVSSLLERFKSDVDTNEKLQLVQRQSNKIAQLVDQIHDFQKADANLLKMNAAHFSFDEFIKDLLADFEFMAESEGKKLTIKRSGTENYVWADKDKLAIICNNLLNNAFKYTQTGDTITVNYSRDNRDLLITVSDSGCGISEDNLPYIFDRFYQSPKTVSANIDGAGIGLAFSKRLIDMHYGFINVKSELNKGTKFDIRLPIIKEFIDRGQTAMEEDMLVKEDDFLPQTQIAAKVDIASISIKYEFSDSLIFYVEDNEDMRDYVSGLLSRFFKVQTFSNGQKCFNALEDRWPDLIISDVLMPEMNGLELCNRVKSDVKTCHLPFILLTACTTIDDQILGIREGADAYIRKPFDAQHLISKSEALLFARKQLRERFQVDFPVTLDKKPVNNGDQAFLEKLYSLLAENLDNQELDLDKIAQQLFLNRTHFYQKVKALTNQTPYELLKTYRLKKAAELLVQGEFSVNEVYLKTGFKSRTHFSKLFKEKYKVSPGKYKGI